MESHLQKVLITDSIIAILAVIFFILFISKRVWAGVVFTSFCIFSFSYGSLRCYSLLFTQYDEVIGTTIGYSSSLKSGGSIKFYFIYDGKRYDESSSDYTDLNRAITKGGRYKVRICRSYPSFNEIDFNNPIDD